MKKILSVALLFILALTITSCNMKQEPQVQGEEKIAKAGDVVLVHYRGSFPEGEVFDSSYDRGSPYEFTVLNNEMIPGFDNAVVGMKVGEKKSITLLPNDAYGERDEANIVILPKTELQEFVDAGIVLEEGAVLPTMIGNLPILAVSEDDVTIDGNHPMAGKTLNFDVELVEIKSSGSIKIEEVENFENDFVEEVE